MNKAVAVNTDTAEVVVATQFWRRVGVDILRGNCRAFRRRLVGGACQGEGRDNPFRGVLGLGIAGGL